ncbi:MAG: hypothetical protein Q9226_007879 [Calogaya cf. arnoldii]
MATGTPSSEITDVSDIHTDVEDESDVDDIKLSLEETLSSFTTFGSFATSGKVPGDVSTGLSIPGIGRIAFPLIEYQAKQIIDVCHQAPFGKGSETIIDENVRKTWELNPSQFELSNSAWNPIVSDLLTTVCNELGCDPEFSVQANLYKLLLYEEGAHFKPHKDTEKEPGMFATLVICLPSEYKGGDVVTRHGGKTKTFDARSSFHHTYVSWYADVTHEVKPVKSGYRIALVYNLINDAPGHANSASLVIEQKQELSKIFRCWNRNSEMLHGSVIFGLPPALVYKLDHKYTDANLKFQALKGLDMVKAQYLRETCADAEVCFYLASMEFKKEGSTEEDGYEEHDYNDDSNDSDEDDPINGGNHALEDIFEERLVLKRIINLEGDLLAQDLSLDEETLIQDDILDRDPDHEDYQGWTGNAGASATHWYRDTSEGKPTWARLFPPLSLYISKSRESIALEDRNTFEEALKIADTHLSIFKLIGTAIYTFKISTDHFTINALLKIITSFNGRIQAMAKLIEGFDSVFRRGPMNPSMWTDMQAWSKSMNKEALQTLEFVDPSDGTCLAKLALKESHFFPDWSSGLNLFQRTTINNHFTQNSSESPYILHPTSTVLYNKSPQSPAV